MKNNSTSPWTNAVNFGLLTGMAIIIYSTLLYITGNFASTSAGWVIYILIAVGFCMATINYRDKALNGFISYGRAVGFSVIVTLYASILYSIFMAIMINIIDPDLIDKLIEASIEAQREMMAKFLPIDAVDKEIEKSIPKMRDSMPYAAPIGVIFNTVIFGTVISLISSIFIRKKNPNIFEEVMKDIE